MEVWDEDKLSRDDFIGLVSLKFDNKKNPTTVDEWFDLKGREGKNDKNVKGKLHLQIKVFYKTKEIPEKVFRDWQFVLIDPFFGYSNVKQYLFIFFIFYIYFFVFFIYILFI